MARQVVLTLPQQRLHYLPRLLPIPPTYKLNGSSFGRPDVDLMFAKWAFNNVAQASENPRAAWRREMVAKICKNCDKFSLTNSTPFRFYVCTRYLLTKDSLEPAHTAASDPIFFSPPAATFHCVTAHRHGLIAGISVFSVSKCAMSAGAGGPRCSVSRACCLRKYASPTPQQNREWTSLRKYAPETTGERIAKICAPPKSHYPRMDIS